MSTFENDQNSRAQAAMSALQNGDAETAASAFKALIQDGATDPDIWLALALAHHGQGKSTNMLEALDQVLEQQPQNLRALVMKGDGLWDIGDPRGAVTFYKRITQLVTDTSQFAPNVAKEITRIQARVKQHSKDVKTHLLDHLQSDGSEPRFQHALDLLFEKRQRFLQEPRAFYFPELPARQFYDPQDFNWTKALISAQDRIIAEFKELRSEPELFAPYIHASGNTPVNPDHPLLNSSDWSAMYIMKDGELNKPIADRMPSVLNALADAPLERVEKRGPTVLVSKLAPGSKIGAHKGFLNTRLTCHLPLIIPEDCGIRVGNETRNWTPGEMLIFNDTIDHEAWNKSSSDRYVLIFFVWRPELSEKERSLVKSLLEGIDTYSTQR